ncbi:proteasome assembly chaperone 3-like [Chrysoperla carnea]|uniref:proteasome assembly chaperone 3-like n=1 Tax=Chrysoperla carnea TaxID=189513 RepID=UPI001D07E735|nr:proteasome assembly chaperone 3-like [Chrysoperla carnea]
MEFVNLMSALSLNDNNTNNSLSFEKDSECILNPISVKIGDIHTEIIFGEYADRIVLIITQYEKIGGSMYLVSKDETGVNGPLTEPVYTTKSLFGTDELLHQVAARFFAEKLSITKPLLIFLCLKDYGPEMLKSIAASLTQK